MSRWRVVVADAGSIDGTLDGGVIDVKNQWRAIVYVDERATVSYTRDVTERQRVARASSASLKEFRSLQAQEQAALLDIAHDAILVKDLKDRIIYWNRGAERTYGWTAAEAIGRIAGDLLHAETTTFREALAALVARADWTCEEARQTKDGRDIIVEVRWVLVQNARGRPKSILAIDSDVTERRRVDQALRDSDVDLRLSMVELHAVSARLNNVREAERARMARDIHDHLGQALTALKMDVAEVARRVKAADLAGVEARLADMTALIDASVNDVRRVAAELRPAILDDLGLVAAIRTYLQDVGRKGGIRCVLFTELTELAIAPDRALALFRILQESITNVIRHAGARQVDVALRADAEAVHLIVHDDGRGIAAAEQRSPRAIGLVGMRDRAHLFGGYAAVTGGPGQGTTVTAYLPLIERAR